MRNVRLLLKMIPQQRSYTINESTSNYTIDSSELLNYCIFHFTGINYRLGTCLLVGGLGVVTSPPVIGGDHRGGMKNLNTSFNLSIIRRNKTVNLFPHV